MSCVVFVGPLPPPLHGFSAINLAMHELIAKNNAELITINRTPAGSKYKLVQLGGQLLKTLFQSILFFNLLVSNKPRSVYIGLSGGMGQIFDLPFLIFSFLFRVNVFIHHHSYAYINSPNRISKIIFYFSKNAKHISLCNSMKLSLQEIYGLEELNVLALSNSAFEVVNNSATVKSERMLTIGFISNITTDKGIFEFFDLMDLLNQNGLKICGRIAGPVNAAIQGEFLKRLSVFDHVQHIGPVYGQSKLDFYSSIDVLSFPTKYVNEAEPVTISEALKNSIPVVAAFRGCIADQIDESCGLVIHNYENIVTSSAEYIGKLLADSDFFEKQKAGALLRFDHLHSENAIKLDQLITEITQGSI